MLRPLAAAVPWDLLAVAAALGLVGGAVAAAPAVGAGFPALAVPALADGIHVGLLAGAVFAALFLLVRRPLARRVTPRLATAIAAGVALAPLVAVAGYRRNRALAIRPREILEPWALVPNLELLAWAALAWAALAFALHFVLHRRDPARRPRRGPVLFLVGALVAIDGAALVLRLLPTPEKSRPDVVLVLVDALRADHVGAYGYARPTTPAIDRLAADGVVFRQAVAQSTFTKTSVASLFTGRNPYQHGVYWGSREAGGVYTADVLPAAETTLAERLRASGYLTAAWVQNSHLVAAMGFGQGFVAYHDQQGAAPRINAGFLGWLAGPARRYPFFAYLHYIDLHDPYQPEPPYDRLFGTYDADVYADVDLAEWGGYLRAVRRGERTLGDAAVDQLEAWYDGLVRLADDHVGEVLARLEALGLYDDALIIITSDHGDGFMEHGFISHSTTPYEELVRVPLIVKLPRGRAAGTTVDAQVRLVDVLPTVLDAAGVGHADGEIAGCSLLPLVRGVGERPDRCTVAVSEVADDGPYPTVMVRTGRFKLIHHGGERADELYDLAADPGERRDLATAGLAEGDPLALLARQVVAAREEAAQDVVLDERQVRDLKALGYIGQ